MFPFVVVVIVAQFSGGSQVFYPANKPMSPNKI
jgi:hypothetical protein